MTAADATEHHVDAGGLRIFYRGLGEGPPLVLLHGGLATGEIMWNASVLADLARRHRVLVPDSRGHGRTGNPAATLRYAQMADDVAAFSAALGLDRPVIVGYSDGAQVAVEIGLRHPALARALVMGGVVTRQSEPYLRTVRELGFPRPGAVDVEQVRAALGDFFPVVQTAHEHARSDDGLRAYLEQISDLWYSVPDYTDSQLATIPVPSLVICGDRDGASVDDSLRLYRALPRGELAIVPNADHGAGDRPVFWAAVNDFLSRHAGREEPDA
jgi:pimeloyl-ACP methyl ester carboxylesterase